MAVILYKLVLGSGLLYAYYFFFLRNRHFHQFNRFYLLLAPVISLLIPFMPSPLNLFNESGQNGVLIRSLRVMNANAWEEPVTIYARPTSLSAWISFPHMLWLVYGVVALTLLLVLVRMVYRIMALRKKHPCEPLGRALLYHTTEPGTPFSFFRHIFWNTRIDRHSPSGAQILRHELYHVQQKHSLDLLLMEICCCCCWFNPFFHIIRRELKAIHEFLADAHAAPHHSPQGYAEMLLQQAMEQQTGIVHPFFHYQLKRRITMLILSARTSRRSGYISRLMALPLLFVMIAVFAFGHHDYHMASPGKIITAVIDPGHGGSSAGVHFGDGLTEKDITLSIARKIQALAPGYHINVILTRNGDAMAGNAGSLQEDLKNRADIANQAKADVFVSVHINMAYGNDAARNSGFEAFVSGRRTDEKSRQLAASLLSSMKEVYIVNDAIHQSSAGVYVLDQTHCPAVLLECGYAGNPADAAFIASAGNQEKLARKILEAIAGYSQAASGAVFAAPAKDMDTLSAAAFRQLEASGSIKTLVVPDKKQDYALVIHKNGKTEAVRISDMTNSPTQKTAVADTAEPLRIFTKVENEASFPGGPQAWKDYLLAHVHYPEAALKENLQGTVVVQFIVDTRGRVSDVKAISGPLPLQAESIRIVKESGNWISATQKGIKVKSWKRQPIIYKLG